MRNPNTYRLNCVDIDSFVSHSSMRPPRRLSPPRTPASAIWILDHRKSPPRHRPLRRARTASCSRKTGRPGEGKRHLSRSRRSRQYDPKDTISADHKISSVRTAYRHRHQRAFTLQARYRKRIRHTTEDRKWMIIGQS